MLLKRLLSRFKSRRSMPYPGDTYLVSVMRVAYERLDDMPTPNLYRACLVGGDVAARLMLTHDSRCLQMWGNGDVSKAAGLLEVWATTIMLSGPRHDTNQDSLPGCIARGFGRLLGSDTARLETELHAFREASRAEIDRKAELGIRTFARDIVYLRTLRALDDPGVPDFDQLPVPWGVLGNL